MNSTDVLSYVPSVLAAFQDVIKSYETAQAVIKQTEDELNDVYHEIEFADLKDLYRGYLLYRDIHDLRVKRREAKKTVEALQDLYDLIKSQQGTNFKAAIQRAQNSVSKVKAAQEKRVYMPRQRTDLTITDRACTANRPLEKALKPFTQAEMTVSFK